MCGGPFSPADPERRSPRSNVTHRPPKKARTYEAVAPALPSPPSPGDHSALWTCHLWAFLIDGTVQHRSFCLVSWTHTASSKSVPVVTGVGPSFSWPNHIPRVDTPPFADRESLDGHWGWVHFLAVL